MAVLTPTFPTTLDTLTTLGRVSNFATTTIGTGGVDASATTVPITDTSAWPSDGVFVSGTEAIAYTGKTGSSVTGCTRGFDGTTAAAHAAGDPALGGVIISAHIEALRDAIIALETAIGITNGTMAARAIVDRGGQVFNVKAYGAVLDGATNDATAIQAAITAATAAGGGDVVIPSGKTAAIASTITLANDVHIVGGGGSGFIWTGASAGTMFTGGTVNPLMRAGMRELSINPGGLTVGANYVLDLHSPQSCTFHNLEVTNHGKATTSAVIRMQADATNASGYFGLRNAVFNVVSGINVIGEFAYGLVCDGQSDGVITLNTFTDVEFSDITICAVRIVDWFDNNRFTGIHRYAIPPAATGGIGVYINDSATPLVDTGVYANSWETLAVDTFGTGSGRIGIKMNYCRGMSYRNYHCEPEPEGGAIVDVAAVSYEVHRIAKAGSTNIEFTSKGLVYQSNQFFNAKVGVGILPTAPLQIGSTIANSPLLLVGGETQHGTTDLSMVQVQAALRPTANLSAGSTYGMIFIPTMRGTNLDTTKPLGNLFGLFTRIDTNADYDSNITGIYGLYSANGVHGGGGTINADVGIAAEEHTRGTHNTNLLVGGAVAAGQWNIYAPSARDNYFAGNLTFASGKGLTAPTFQAGTATAGSHPKLTAGTLLTTPEAGAMEYDGSGRYFTVDTTSGRARLMGFNEYRLAANGSAIGAAIADFFPAPSSLSLAASSTYVLEAVCYFTKTTAGTVLWTLLASSAPTNMTISYDGPGVAATTTNMGTSAAATTVATGASASLTTGVNFMHMIYGTIVTNAACNIRLRVTSSAGTVTPLMHSIYRVRRISTANVGNYVT